MVIFQFRIESDDIDELVRVIQIKATQNFLDFHMAIQESIGFDATKEAFFHQTTDNWRVEQLICSSEKKGKMLDKVKMNQVVADPHQKFIYISDSELEWMFKIELIKMIKESDTSKTFPVCIKKEGENPKQYKNPFKLGASPSDDLFEEAEQMMADRKSDDDEDLENLTEVSGEEI